MQRLSKDGHAHSVTSDSMKRLRLPQIAILVGAGVAASSDYCSGPKLPPRVKWVRGSPPAGQLNCEHPRPCEWTAVGLSGPPSPVRGGCTAASPPSLQA
ncbi:hypothetical protein HaLaN_17947 [Haematococcus lacustris]|uniref:Uncharacterized protein n=1 Tax=Haematococcus lacustris TaxID=44745 RepID=A0A699ZI05_HAELA|nr:hypothetical protein HaLaN_17947 [Haematococcus lacustris]